jgi:small subunit ribosomal protein S18
MPPDPRKKKVCNFCADRIILIDFKDSQKLRRYLTDRGKILPRRITGTCAYHQRKLAAAIKLSRHMSLVPYVMQG